MRVNGGRGTTAHRIPVHYTKIMCNLPSLFGQCFQDASFRCNERINKYINRLPQYSKNNESEQNLRSRSLNKIRGKSIHEDILLSQKEF